MKESDFLSFKRELWDIIRSEGIVVTNQNLDWLLERAFKENRHVPPPPPTSGSNVIRPKKKIEIVFKKGG